MHLEGSFQNRLTPALACFDIASIARGFAVLDATLKRATVKVECAKAVSSGKFILRFLGDIANVEESYVMAKECAASFIDDEVLLPNPHPALFKRRALSQSAQGASVLIAEFATVSSTLRGADLALKACEVQLGTMVLADGIDGKGFFILHGALCHVEAALELMHHEIAEGKRPKLELIANPSPEMGGFLSIPAI